MISLDDIRAAADAKYSHYPITLKAATEDEPAQVSTLLNALRISKEKRQKLTDLQKAMKEDGADQVALIKEAIKVVAASPSDAKALLDQVGDDLAVLAEVFTGYGKATQVGEASASRE